MSVICSIVPEKVGTVRPTAIEPITCALEVVTPMFLAGADQQDIAKELLRVPSLRGMLRWWWRAAQGDGDHQTLLKRERDVWGGLPDKDREKPPRGPVIRTWRRPPKDGEVAPPKTQRISGGTGTAEYYLSYALGGTKDADQRQGFSPSQLVQLQVVARDKEQADAVRLALDLLVTFGGLGSRNRRTWGSLAYVGDGIKAPERPAEVQRRMMDLLETVPGRRLDGRGMLRTVLGRGCRIETAACGFTHMQLLETVHAFWKGADKLHKEAWCFGLPHTKGKGAMPDGPQWVKRRASPIMLKATRLAAGNYALSALLTDGAFLDFTGHPGDQSAYTAQAPKLALFLDKVRDCTVPIRAGR